MRLYETVIDWFLRDDAKMIIPHFTYFFLLIPMGMWTLIDPVSVYPGIGWALGLILNLIPLILSAKYPRGRNRRQTV